MAEILGIVAGVVGIADVGLRLSQRVHRVVQDWQNAPDDILALGREVSDITVAMRSIQDACQSVKVSLSADPEVVINLRMSTEKAATILDEIDSAIQELASTPKFKRRAKWLAMRSPLGRKRQGLRDLRVNIRDILSAWGVSSDVRVELELLSLKSNLKQANETVAERLDTISRGFSQLSQQLVHLERADTKRMRTNKGSLDSAISDSVHQLLMGRQQPERDTIITTRDTGSFRGLTHENRYGSGYFTIEAAYRNRGCTRSCTCSCHSEPTDTRCTTWRTPPVVRRLLGVLFAQYSGSPTSNTICDNLGCKNTHAKTLEVVYDFPLWCLNWGIHVLVQRGITGSPSLTLTPRYRVSFRAGGLLHAVNSSNIDLVRASVEASPYSVHFQAYQTGYTALHYACLKCDDGTAAEIIRLLLRSGADFSVENDNGQSAGSIAACQILLGLMPDALVTEISNWTSVSRLVEEVELSPISEVVLGVRMGNIETMLRNMTPSRLKLHEFDNTGNTPLYWAARAGDLPIVKALVRSGVDINIRTKSNKTSLIGACDSTVISTECFRWLLQNGADPYQTDSNGFNSLTSGCCRRTLPAVQELLAWGLNVNTRDAMGRTGLSCAAQYDQNHIVSYLLDQNADTELENRLGWTPVINAVLNNSHKCLRILLRRGADHTFVSRYGWSILHCAAQAGDLQTMRILTEHRLRGVDARARTTMYGNLNAEEIFLKHRRKHPQAEVLLAALRGLIAAVEEANNEVCDVDEDWEGREEIFYEAVEYLL
ncbi:hypothetical protein B0T14DRAFT_246703 [Immersiella caudata]|uniref:Ankyrin n=1 Tax=Immersiella caudata TaxID=314043 RepID=A0AA40BWT7_9PEZI|nr:hypothetical protein B0T14DRAFT_246703 [Immersiella caudata]